MVASGLGPLGGATDLPQLLLEKKWPSNATALACTTSGLDPLLLIASGLGPLLLITSGLDPLLLITSELAPLLQVVLVLCQEAHGGTLKYFNILRPLIKT